MIAPLDRQPPIEALVGSGLHLINTDDVRACATTFPGMKRCVNQTHVVPTANGNYSDYVDDLVASSSATLLPMNDRIAPPAAFVHSPGRKGAPLPAGFLCKRSMRSPRARA